MSKAKNCIRIGVVINTAVKPSRDILLGIEHDLGSRAIPEGIVLRFFLGSAATNIKNIAKFVSSGLDALIFSGISRRTRLAVGIRFNAEEAPLPRICAIGSGRVAKIIRETALAEGIPIMEDRPLARALYAEGKIEDFIPESLIEPVAEVLKWAKQLQDARKEEEELDSVTLEDL